MIKIWLLLCASITSLVFQTNTFAAPNSKCPGLLSLENPVLIKKLNATGRLALEKSTDENEQFEFIIHLGKAADRSLLSDLEQQGLKIDSQSSIILTARGTKTHIASLIALPEVQRIEFPRIVFPEYPEDK